MENLTPINILLVEDNPADIDLTKEAFADAKLNNKLYVCEDGVEAMDFLYQRNTYTDVPRPDLILLDLNMPRKTGLEVLEEIYHDKKLLSIPIVILTTSEYEGDITRSYDFCANCYITKPVDFNQFMEVVQKIQNFWLTVVKLPH